MALHHIGLAKAVAWGSVAVWAIVIAMDPTVKVAFIMSGGMVCASVPALVLGLLNRKDNRASARALLDGQANMQKSVDGKLDQFIETKQQLSHAEGFRAGSESERITETKGE
jgi:hypothetical protein